MLESGMLEYTGRRRREFHNVPPNFLSSTFVAISGSSFLPQGFTQSPSSPPPVKANHTLLLKEIRVEYCLDLGTELGKQFNIPSAIEKTRIRMGNLKALGSLPNCSQSVAKSNGEKLLWVQRHSWISQHVVWHMIGDLFVWVLITKSVG